jgi:hypothetical protein
MVTRRKFAEAAVCGFARSLWGILGTGSLFRRTSGLEEAKILDYWSKGDLILVKRLPIFVASVVKLTACK